MAIYAVLLEISDPVPRGITNFANRETARKMRALRNSGEAGGSIWRWHILARISTNDQVFISYQSYSLMTNITEMPEILEPVPRGITKFAIRDAARTMRPLRKSEVKVGKD